MNIVNTENFGRLKSKLNALNIDSIKEIETIAGYKVEVAEITRQFNSMKSMELLEQVRSIDTRMY